ncbi:MAG: 2TM domain-containing protein [Actinobacteria bacterium]|nr:2TM domain-containing protein [Actinomycetota bacterium]
MDNNVIGTGGSLRFVLPAERDERLQRMARVAFVAHARTYVVVNGFLIGVWALAGFGPFWPAWVILSWGLALVLHSMATFSRNSH